MKAKRDPQACARALALREALVAEGAYDGRFAPRTAPCKKREAGRKACRKGHWAPDAP